MLYRRATGAFYLALGLALVWALGVLPASAVHAQSTVITAADAKFRLDAARSDIAAIQKTIGSNAKTLLADGELSRLRTAALLLRAEGEDALRELEPALSSVQARLGQLGAPAAGSVEATDVAVQRTQLEKNRIQIDSQIKLARLLIIEAEQVAAELSDLRRQQFQASLGERTASILGPNFWSEVRDDFPRDAARIKALGSEVADAIRQTPGWVVALMLAALAGIAVLRWWLGGLLLRLTATHVPASRLRRTLHAVSIVLLSVSTAALAAAALGVLLGGQSRTGQPMTTTLQALAGALLTAVCMGAYMTGLGRALLSPGRPSWRLSTLPDNVALGLRWFPPQLAVLVGLVIMLDNLAPVLNTSLATTVAVNCIIQLAIGISMAVATRRGERLWRQAVEARNPGASPANAANAASAASFVGPVVRISMRGQRPIWLVVLVAAGWLVLVGSVICLLAGFVAFGSFVVKQIVWTAIVLGSAYLLAVLVKDVFSALLAADADADADADITSAPRHGLGEQAAVLLTGVSRIVIALVALMLLLAPLGAGPGEVFRRTGELQDGIQIGQVSVSIGSMLQALLVLGIAIAGVRLFRGWLQNTYLPTTRLDPGMRSSATTLIGYAGYIAAVSLAMSAVGIGLDRVAWVASALSVGIGFGLQAVVQNFVSGLILLAERPVKVGDWVSLGTVEGDIRSINMRATEIQLGDRSTVIVPNSEFITKIVRNVTLSDPLGLVQVKLSLPLPLRTDAEKVSELLLAVFARNADVLADPAPSVHLEGIDNGNLTFSATGFASSPRASYGVRSALLFDTLKTLAEAGIELSRPAQTITFSQSNAPVAPTGPAGPVLPESSAAARPAEPPAARPLT